MVGSEADCDPDLVVAKASWKNPRARRRQCARATGWSVVWGRFYRDRRQRLRPDVLPLPPSRHHRDAGESPRRAGRSRARSPASSSPAPRARSRSPTSPTSSSSSGASTIVRQTPQETASGSPMPQGPLPYWISDTQRRLDEDCIPGGAVGLDSFERLEVIRGRSSAGFRS
jgi:hypothetical protein